MTFEEFRNKYCSTLNEQQLSAVTATEGAVLLLAVPGSGKTTVLVLRLGYMIFCLGRNPEELLTLTYTVSAAGDMKRRFEEIFGKETAPAVEFRTINGVCAKIISGYSRLVGKTPFALCTEEKKILRLLSACYQETVKEFPQESDLKSVRTLVTYIKNRMLSPEELRSLDEEQEIPVSEIYRSYCRKMREEGLMDYDDQMIYALNILKKSPETLAAFRKKCRYLLVDEAQDTSRIQHEVIRLLAGESENLFMVGDEDQSIYGFRAAWPEALLHFGEDHPGARILYMEKNYRSTENIVRAADAFIQKNTLRHKKQMKAVRGPAFEIETVRVRNRAAQAEVLCGIAASCTEETAVLYRDNESAVPVIDLLSRKNIPYRMRSTDAAFFTHRTVMDIRSLIRLSLDPLDAGAFLAVYYKLGLYLNKKAAMSIADTAQRDGIPLLTEALRTSGLPPYSYEAIRKLSRELRDAASLPAKKALENLIYNTGYIEYLDRSGMDTGKLTILLSVAGRETGLESFEARLDTLRDMMAAPTKNAGCPFLLSTIHASKGLEYKNVYLIDLEDGIFPERVPTAAEKKDPDTLSAYEEERRLFYVGVTRAKDRLFLLKTGKASTFHRELLPDYYKKAEKETVPKKKAAPGSLLKDAVAKKKFDETEFRCFCDSLTEGTVLTHKKLGRGTVTENNGEKIAVQFPAGRKVLLLRRLYENDLVNPESL